MRLSEPDLQNGRWRTMVAELTGKRAAKPVTTVQDRFNTCKCEVLVWNREIFLRRPLDKFQPCLWWQKTSSLAGLQSTQWHMWPGFSLLYHCSYLVSRKVWVSQHVYICMCHKEGWCQASDDGSRLRFYICKHLDVFKGDIGTIFSF